MSDIYRSQFFIPYSLIEQLTVAANKSGRTVDAELIARLEQSFSGEPGNADVRTVLAILERLSRLNPDVKFQFGVSTKEADLRPAEIVHGEWTLAAQTPTTAIDANVDPQPTTRH